MNSVVGVCDSFEIYPTSTICRRPEITDMYIQWMYCISLVNKPHDLAVHDHPGDQGSLVVLIEMHPK